MSPDFFRFEHRVTYAECTIGNHIYYARYLDILEAARGEFFRHLGQPLLKWQEAGVIFPVVENHIRFKAAARYDDPLIVEVRVIALARVKLGFGYFVRHADGRLLVESESLHACTSTNDRLQRIPIELAAALKPFLIPAC